MLICVFFQQLLIQNYFMPFRAVLNFIMRDIIDKVVDVT